MKVRELIELLEEQDGEAEILVMSQASYPFECALYGITSRAELEGDDEDEGDEGDDGDGEAPKSLRDGQQASDVFLVEGQQLRYGSKLAWEVAAR
jgi:hypothetical protein